LVDEGHTPRAGFKFQMRSEVERARSGSRRGCWCCMHFGERKRIRCRRTVRRQWPGIESRLS